MWTLYIQRYLSEIRLKVIYLQENKKKPNPSVG